MYIYIVNRYTTVKPLWYNLGLLETTTLKGFTTKIALPPFLVRKFHFYIWYFKEHGRKHWLSTVLIKTQQFFGCSVTQRANNSYFGVAFAQIKLIKKQSVQVNLCQKLLFLHQLTHNMTTDCSLNYKFSTWKFQAQTWREHVVYRNCFWHSEQFLYTSCSPHVLQKEELLTKIYLYH